MKKTLLSLVLILLITPIFSQENIDVKEKTVKSDYVTKRTVMGATRVIEDEITCLRVTHVTVYKETSYTEYVLLDSVFRYDSLLPTDFNEYTLSDQWGNYEPDYGYDDYDDYDDGYDNYDYDDYDYTDDDYNDDGYDDGYYDDDNSQYDDEYKEDYQVEGEDVENGELQDSTYLDDELEEPEELEEMDSSYVFLSYDLEYLSQEEIVNNFATYIPEALSLFDNVEGHKVHKISLLDTSFVVDKDTISSFELEAVSWDGLRQLPLKLFVGQELEKFGKRDSIYVVEMNKPMTYEAILRVIMNIQPDFEINKTAWSKLESFAVDPNEYLADIVWISYLLPYYSANINEPYLREIFVNELKKKRVARIIEFEKICSYDFRKERSFENIIQNKTILKNPRFERSIDPVKKVPIIRDNSQLAFSVTEELNADIGRYEYVNAGVISTMYETEEVTMADPKTGQPISFTRLKIDPKTNNPILLETASFSVTFKSLNLEALKTTTRNMKYDISKLVRKEHFINQKYLRELGKL